MDLKHFAARTAFANLVLFGLLRLPWVEAHFVIPLTAAEARAAVALAGAPTSPLAVGSSCSGTDAGALLVAAILAFPASWAARLRGAAGGVVLALALNIVRIATLGRVASDPRLLDLLHLWIWPSVLVVALAGYTLLWMRGASRARETPAGEGLLARPRVAFMTGAMALLLFVLLGPLYQESAALDAVSGWAASSAASVLDVLHVDASASGSVLTTTRGAFLVTPECLATPLIPLYVTALLVLPLRFRVRLLGLVATAPLFFALGVVRLLVLALPRALVISPEQAIHAFFQVLLGATAVGVVSYIRHRQTEGTRAIAWRAALGLLAGVATAAVAGGLVTRVALGAAARLGGAPEGASDPQGAWLVLPAFALSLLVSLAVAEGRWAPARLGAAVLLLLAAQIVLAAAAGGVSRAFGVHLAAREVRGLALALPLLLVWALHRLGPVRRGGPSVPSIRPIDA